MLPDVTSRDIVAAEAHYHRSCYREYTRPEKPSPSSSSTAEVRDDAEEKAFSDLFKYIQLEVIETTTLLQRQSLPQCLKY